MQCSAWVLCVPIMRSTKYRWKVKHLSLDSLFIQQNDIWKKKYAMDQSKTLNWSWNSLLNMDDCFLNSPFSSQLSYGQVYLEGEFLVGCSFRSSLHIDDLIHWEVNPPVWNGSLTCKDCYMGHSMIPSLGHPKCWWDSPFPNIHDLVSGRAVEWLLLNLKNKGNLVMVKE